jgi:hypothetical protein
LISKCRSNDGLADVTDSLVTGFALPAPGRRACNLQNPGVVSSDVCCGTIR